MEQETKKAIDFDRGAIFSIHPVSGMNIYMYADDPGYYLNAFGGPVPEALAKEAGFNVDVYSRARIRKERMEAAHNAIEQELAEVSQEKAELVSERKGFTVEHIGLGAHRVKDPDGNVLNVAPLSAELAIKLMERLTPDMVDSK